jgi:hypothetical protein
MSRSKSSVTISSEARTCTSGSHPCGVIENVESTKRQYALVKRRCVEAATMDYATRQVAKVAGASPRVKSGLIANSSTDTPSKLTS